MQSAFPHHPIRLFFEIIRTVRPNNRKTLEDGEVEQGRGVGVSDNNSRMTRAANERREEDADDDDGDA